MRKSYIAFFASILLFTAHGEPDEQSIGALIQNIREVIPEGWTVSYDKQYSSLQISRDEAVWDWSVLPNSPAFEHPQKGRFMVAFRISAVISPAEYQRLSAENTDIQHEIALAYDDLEKRHLNHKFDEFVPKTDSDKAAVERYEALKKSLHDIPEYHFRDLSLETANTPIEVAPGSNRAECEGVQKKVNNLLSKYH